MKRKQKRRSFIALLLVAATLFSSVTFVSAASSGNKNKSSTSSTSKKSDSHKHSVSQWTVTKKATTENGGKREGICKKCGKKVKENIPKIASVTLRYQKGVFNGNELKNTVTVTDKKGNKLKKGTDYTVAYKNNKWVGTAKVTVNFIGNYSGKATRKFTIVPVAPSIKSMTAYKESIKLKWEKNKKQTDFYEIEYSRYSDFRNSKKVKTEKNVSSTTITELDRLTTYYVRIRACKEAGGKKYYSSWSKYKKAKTNGEYYDVPYCIAQGKKVKSSYFDDAVFVGDSISVKLTYYNATYNVLGKAKFLTAGSLGSTNALWKVSNKSVHPRYNGQKMKVEDAISQMKGVKKVYIMLGMNDICFVGENKALENFLTLCDNIKKKSPNVVFYVQSVTPRVKMTSTGTVTELTNEKITHYNRHLSEICRDKGWYFINVASVMFDNTGNLKSEYCSDPSSMGMHFTNEGCKAWVDYLYTHTA